LGGKSKNKTPDPEPVIGLGRRGYMAVGLIALAYTITFTVLSLLRHHLMHSATYDLGLFDNLLFNMKEGRFFESSVKGFNYMGDHCSPILVLLTPLYWIWDDVRMLLVFQSAAVAISAFPFAAAAAELTGSAAAGVALSAVFLLHPNLGYTNLFDFHPEILVVPILSFSLYFLKTGKTWTAVALAIFALTVKEEVSVTIAFFGVYIFFTSSRAAGFTLSAVSLAWFLVAMYVVMPAFKPPLADPGYLYMERYGHLGKTMPEMLASLFINPYKAFIEPYHQWKGVTFLRLFFTAGFLPFIGFPLLLVAFPAMIFLYVSTYLSQFDIRFQYLTICVPFIMYAMLDGFVVVEGLFEKASGRFNWPFVTRRRIIAGMCIILLGMASFTVYWIIRTQGIYGSFRPPANIKEIKEAMELIPRDASVAALNLTGAHLAHRRYYEFAAPFEPHSYHYEKLKLPQYSNAEYQLFTFDETKWTMERIWPRLTELKYMRGYETLYEKNQVLLLHRPYWKKY
jgi:uncharacterized membrane protein